MKKFCLVTGIVCYAFALVAVICTIICSFEKPTAGFYVTMGLSFMALCANGTLFLYRYKDEKREELYKKWKEIEVDD